MASEGQQTRYSVNLNVPQMPRNFNMAHMAQGLLPNLPSQFTRPVRPVFHHGPRLEGMRPSSVVLNMDSMAPEFMQARSNLPPHLNLQQQFDLQQQLASLHDINQNTNGTATNPQEEPPPSPNGGLENQLDWRLFVSWLQNSGIFIILLFLKLMYDHRLGVLIFLALGGTFYYVNQKLVASIHQCSVRESGNKRYLLQLGGLVFYLFINMAFVYYMFSDQALWKSLIFRTPNVAGFDIWTLLWVVLINDYMIKFATVIIKAFITMIPSQLLKHRRRGKYYMFIEYLSQCFRQIIPIIPWMHFLSDDQHTGKWFASFEVIVYLLFKVNIVWASIRELQKAFQRLRVHTVFGSKPGSEDLKQRGENCPICQDELKDAVMLTCKHIFCEDCVSVWFDRERTCPMCRAQITDNPSFQDGTTVMHLQWY
ncbi:RING finger and transmembrane domain-containing protein 2 [Patella vulgata]|uniref:RING finger and transmembrane domain-containing protein 2 n=1 Tax=Patella vulgata TaxID=6465 RepID=UPI00217FB983|nr:RING finger and transmembrane domain-containing protein 2 [Patella vulgata]XP_050411470.1 RING finger and transmembrane domain-containing protein 2 [Patella vulgata]